MANAACSQGPAPDERSWREALGYVPATFHPCKRAEAGGGCRPPRQEGKTTPTWTSTFIHRMTGCTLQLYWHDAWQPARALYLHLRRFCRMVCQCKLLHCVFLSCTSCPPSHLSVWKVWRLGSSVQRGFGAAGLASSRLLGDSGAVADNPQPKVVVPTEDLCQTAWMSISMLERLRNKPKKPLQRLILREQMTSIFVDQFSLNKITCYPDYHTLLNSF